MLEEETARELDPDREVKDFGFSKCHFETMVSHLLAVTPKGNLLDIRMPWSSLAKSRNNGNHPWDG